MNVRKSSSGLPDGQAMREALFLLPLLLIGCASNSRQPATTARFIPQSNSISVTVSDSEAAHAIELVSLTGGITEATSVKTAGSGQQGTGGRQRGGGFGGGSGGGGMGGGLVRLFSSELQSLGSGSSAGRSVRSSATIVVDRPDDYRQNWRDYHIQVEFGDPPGRTVTLNAPEPPQQSPSDNAVAPFMPAYPN